MHSFDDVDSSGGPEPTVESPMAAPTTAPAPDFSVKFERLHIEELPPTPPGGSLENFCKMEHAVVLPPPGAFDKPIPKPRPRNLDLLANKRSHLYVFQGSQDTQ